MSKNELNFRDLGGIPFADGSGTVPKGLFLRGGKLSVLTREECARLCQKYRIRCVIDLRTPVEAAEFPDPLPDDVDYLQIPLLESSTLGITHETGSDPMTIIRNLRKNPERLKEMVPDFEQLYKDLVTHPYSRAQLEKVVSILKENAESGRCTYFHCTAGKDRTGVVSMVLLKSYGVSNDTIISDYMRTNLSTFWPTLRKCVGVLLLTWNWDLVRTAYKSYMADKHLIEMAIRYYDNN